MARFSQNGGMKSADDYNIKKPLVEKDPHYLERQLKYLYPKVAFIDMSFDMGRQRISCPRRFISARWSSGLSSRFAFQNRSVPNQSSPLGRLPADPCSKAFLTVSTELSISSAFDG
jgi:hypothetical protein